MPRKTSPTVDEAVAKFVAVRAMHVAKTTHANEQSLLRKFAREVGVLRVHQLTPEVVESWFAAEAMRQSPSSYNKTRQRVSGFLAFATRRGWLDTDPLSEVRPRRVPTQERMRLSAGQLRDLVEGAHIPRDRGMLGLAVSTGLRASDLVALRVGNVDLAEGYVHLIVQKTQTADSIPLTEDADEELRRWLRWYAERLAMSGQSLEPDAYLFSALGPRNVRHGREIFELGDPRPYSQQRHPEQVVQRALAKIGITGTKGQGFHLIRRSVARLLFDTASAQGYDNSLRLTAALLGHRSTATTQAYLGVEPDRIRRDELLKGRSLLGKPAEVTRLHQVT